MIGCRRQDGLGRPPRRLHAVAIIRLYRRTLDLTFSPVFGRHCGGELGYMPIPRREGRGCTRPAVPPQRGQRRPEGGPEQMQGVGEAHRGNTTRHVGGLSVLLHRRYATRIVPSQVRDTQKEKADRFARSAFLISTRLSSKKHRAFSTHPNTYFSDWDTAYHTTSTRAGQGFRGIKDGLLLPSPGVQTDGRSHLRTGH